MSYDIKNLYPTVPINIAVDVLIDQEFGIQSHCSSIKP